MSKEQLKKYGTTFHFAGQFLSSKQIEAASALYGICREIDDIADKTADKDSAKIQLSHLKNSLIDRDKTHPLVAKALTIQPALTLDALIELTDGVLLDTSDVVIESEGELLRYCYQVAGTVGLLMCDLFEVKDPVARHHAVDLGVAMQLTNICRDVREDAANGRVYLPKELLGSINADDILAPTEETKSTVKSVVNYLLTEAETRYESGISGLCFLPAQARFAILIAAMTYREIGMIIADWGFDIWRGRAYTTKTQKTLVAIKGLTSFLFSRKMHHYKGFHDPELHRGLNDRPGVHWA